MRIVAYGETDTGKKKSANEDSYLIDDELGLYIVADGVSRSTAGDVASYGACQIMWKIFKDNKVLLDSYKRHPSAELRDKLCMLIQTAVRRANHEVYQKGLSDPTLRGMATTVVALLIINDLAVVASVGDSRIYLLRDGRQNQITQDHSVIVEQFGKGAMTEQEAASSRFQSILTRALGWQADTGLDVEFFEVVPGDIFLLCSDGLSDYFQGEEFGVLAQKIPADQLPKAFIQMANSRGGKDNITALVTQVQGDTSPGQIDASKKMNALRSVPMFSEMTFVEMVKVLNIAKLKITKKGSIAVKPTRDQGVIFVLVVGKASIIKGGKVAKELEPGSFVGEMSIIDPDREPPRVRADAPCALLMLERDPLRDLMQNDTQIAAKYMWTYIQMLYQKLRKSDSATQSIFESGVGDDLNMNAVQSLLRNTMDSQLQLDDARVEQELKSNKDLSNLI